MTVRKPQTSNHERFGAGPLGYAEAATATLKVICEVDPKIADFDAGSFSLLPQPNAWPFAVLGHEDDAGRFKGIQNSIPFKIHSVQVRR